MIMHKTITFLVAITICIGLTGCISGVRMTKVTRKNPDPDGLRVCLPAKFLVGRTSANTNYSGLVYDIEMLPDPNQEYAISSYAYLAKQNVAVHRSIEGYLKELDLSEDTTGAAAASLAASGQIASAYFASLNNKTSGTNTPAMSNPKQPPATSSPPTPATGTPPAAGTPSPSPGPGTPSLSSPTTVSNQPGAIRVMFRIVDIPPKKCKKRESDDNLEFGGLKLERMTFPIYNFRDETTNVPLRDLDQTSLYPIQ
jgi:hypothetical protein